MSRMRHWGRRWEDADVLQGCGDQSQAEAQAEIENEEAENDHEGDPLSQLSFISPVSSSSKISLNCHDTLSHTLIRSIKLLQEKIMHLQILERIQKFNFKSHIGKS